MGGGGGGGGGGLENEMVTFLAREKKKAARRSKLPVEISGVEFTRCWSLHILPKGFTKSRCYGGYSSANRTQFIAKCKLLLPSEAVALQDEHHQIDAPQPTPTMTRYTLRLP